MKMQKKTLIQKLKISIYWDMLSLDCGARYIGKQGLASQEESQPIFHLHFAFGFIFAEP